MADKRLIIVVDSAAEMGFHWQTILTDYLERIIRYFDYQGSTSQGLYGTKSMLGLIVYGSQGPGYESLVQPSGWTSDVESFLQWLSALSFTSVGFDESALAKGLSSALKMIAATQNGNETQLFGQRHCILVSSSNSGPLLRPLQLPNYQTLDYGRISKAKIEGYMTDAEAVAKSFIQSFVSLSVISPKQSPRLIEIYNAGNVNKRGVEFLLNGDKNPNYLILLSDNFMEAHAALIPDGLKSVPAVDNHQGTDVRADLVSPFQEDWSDEDLWMIRNIISEPLPATQHKIPTGNMLTAVELEQLLMEEKCDDDEEIRQFQEKLSESTTVNDMMMIFQEVLNQPAGTNQQELLAENNSTTAPVQQNHQREHYEDVDEVMMILQEVINQPAGMNQQEILAENYSRTAPVQQNDEREQYEDVDDMMRIFQEVINQPAGTNQQELLAENYSRTAPVQQNNEREQYENDGTIMIFGGIASESTINQQEIPKIDITTVLDMLEPDAVKSKKPRQASPNGSTSQIEKGFGDHINLKATPTGVVLSQSTSPGTLAAANPSSLLSNVNQHKVLKSTAITAGSPSESQIIGNGIKSSPQAKWSLAVNSEALARTPQNAQYATTGSIASGFSTLQSAALSEVDGSTNNLCQSVPSSFKSESPGAPRAARKNTTGFFGSATYGKSKKSRNLAKFQGSASASQLLPSKTGQRFPWSQMVQNEYNLKRRLTNSFGQSSITNGAGNLIFTEQGAKESLAVTNTFGIKTPLLPYASGALIERPPDGYVKAWEGDLTTKEKGQTVLVNRLVAYRKKTASEMLVANWPRMLHMEQLVAKPQVDNIRHAGEVEYLIFDAMNRQSKLDQLEEKKMCAYVKLPRQTLILSVSIEKSRFIGTLYNGDFALFQHKMFNAMQQQ